MQVLVLQKIPLKAITRQALPTRRAFTLRAMASQTPIFDLAVKGDPATGILADCPFSHRALLHLEEKHVPYTKTLIDLDAKPQWLLDVNPAGSVPVLKDLSTGDWTVDSGVIADMLEARFPEPPLGTVEGSPQVGGAIFPTFKEFVKAAKGADAEAKEGPLLAALDELESYLVKNGGPYVGGATVCATDCSLMPKLYHMTVALKHNAGWEMPGKYKAIRSYMDAFMARDSWKNTYYSPELVIKGWVRHGVKPRLEMALDGLCGSNWAPIAHIEQIN